MKTFHLHLVSDATGETVHKVAEACLSQFDHVRAIEHVWSMVRTKAQLDRVIAAIEANPGVVMFTLVDESLRSRLQESCRRLHVPYISVLDQVIAVLGGYVGVEMSGQPGRQHALDAAYFQRIDAMEFTLAHDDGQGSWDLDQADVVVVGVSRTSKTPTCMYLANRGLKAANVPFVPDCPLPAELDRLTRPLVVGLTKDPDQLVQIRRNRLRMLDQDEQSGYVDPDQVREEVLGARRYFARRRWPVIDVTRRSIEETAAAILQLYGRRREAQE